MKKITPESLMEIRFLSSPSVSPDGRYTAFVQAQADQKKNEYKGNIFVLENATGETWQLTAGDKEFSFVWENGNTLLFSAQRNKEDEPEKKTEEKSVFYRICVHGGEAVRAFSVDRSVEDIFPLKDGRYVLGIQTDWNKEGLDKNDKYALEDQDDYHVLEEIPFWANGAGFISGKRKALFLFDPKDSSLKRLTSEKFQVGTVDVLDNDILYTGQEYSQVCSDFSEVRIYHVQQEKEDILLPAGKMRVDNAVLTQSGALIVASTMDKHGSGQNADMYRCARDGSNFAMVSSGEGMCIGGAGIGDCSYGGGRDMVAVDDDIWFVVTKKHCQELWHLDKNNTLTVKTHLEGIVKTLSYDKKEENCYFVAQVPGGLDELYKLDSNGNVSQITRVNEAFLQEYIISVPKYMPFIDSDGVEVEGWLLPPVEEIQVGNGAVQTGAVQTGIVQTDAIQTGAVQEGAVQANAVENGNENGNESGNENGKKWPAVLEIHGGPRCAYSTVFFHEMQLLCARGYYVAFCNPRGSESYGDTFADLRGKYGTVDYQDLMEFTDHVLKNTPQIDSTRFCATGGSYGGFMCNWIEGHTDRFAAIASQRSVSNWVSDFGSSEIGYCFDKDEMLADPWTDMEKMWWHSPLKYANKAKTPILFIHSLCDYNCTLDQGLEMFSAMKYFGVPSRMCLFEGENHSLSRSGKPRHRLRRLQEILNWFDKYTKPEEAVVAEPVAAVPEATVPEATVPDVGTAVECP